MTGEDISIQWVLFTPRIEWRDAADQLGQLANCQIVNSRLIGGRPSRVAWRLFALPWLAKRHRVSVLLNPVGNGPLWMPRAIPLVVTLHDVAWKDGRQWYSGPYRMRQRLLTSCATRLAKRIFAVSNHSARQIESELRVPPGRITVVRNSVRRFEEIESSAHGGGANASFEVPQNIKPMALFVGTLIRRKNLSGVWRAFDRIRKENGLDVNLVVVGAPRDAKTITAEIRADPNVHLLGYVSDQRLADLYRRASFLVLPSFDEGSGMPVIEAMSLGTPVITSSSSALRENAGDAALLVDPAQDEQIYAAMLRLFTDKRLRYELRGRGLARAGAFSWKNSAEVALTALKSVAAEQAGAQRA